MKKLAEALILRSLVEDLFKDHDGLKVEADNALDNLRVTGTVQTEKQIDKWVNGGIPNVGEPVGDNGKREAFIPLMATHGNPPHSLIKRTWERVKGVLHRGH
ncbi:hypothetical protein [Secundilactobacillus similis]|uniref:hypothetical protein n=1 Tax=Secundilactobacillus similis TaxID=414682 RepID=UPI0006D1D501|nr:hypothetical protein [Secundilactobacillus similis]